MLVNGPGVTDLELGADGGAIVTDGTIAARTGFDGNDPLEFTVVVTFTMAGNTANRACDGQGTGTFNTATVVFDRGTNDDSDCVSLPLPQITVDKEPDMAVAELVDGNTYKAEYTVTVTNSGDGPGHYDLADLPAFGTGVNVIDVTIDPAIVDDVNIDPHDTDEYTVTVTFTVDPAMPASERECGAEPTAGQGAYNLATVTFDGGSDDDDACIDIPVPDISVTKVATTEVATNVSGNTYEAVFTVTVSNTGDGPGSYDLDDLPDFGAGATVTDVEFDPEFSGPVGINAGETDVYAVTVTFTVDGSMTTEDRECAEEPTAGQGAYNGVTVSFNDGGTDHDADCIDIPEPEVSRNKIIDPEHPLTRNLGGTWTIGYILTVRNADGAGPASYDIDDELSFGPGVVISDVAVTEDIPSVTPNADFDGQTDTNIASGVADQRRRDARVPRAAHAEDHGGPGQQRRLQLGGRPQQLVDPLRPRRRRTSR